MRLPLVSRVRLGMRLPLVSRKDLLYDSFVFVTNESIPLYQFSFNIHQMHECFTIKNLTCTLTVHKILLGNCQQRSWIFFQCNSYNKTIILILVTKVFRNCTRTVKVQKKISWEILKCVFEVTEFQSPFRSKLKLPLCLRT